MADRIGVIEEGGLLQLGSPREIYEPPGDVDVARRLALAADQPAADRRLPPSAAPAAPRRWACAPRMCRLERQPVNGTRVEQVEPLERLGDQSRAAPARSPGARMHALMPGLARGPQAAATPCGIVSTEAMLFFAADGRRLAA